MGEPALLVADRRAESRWNIRTMENRRRFALGFAPPGLEPEFASRRHEDQSRRFPGERWIAPRQFARYRVSGRPENGSGRLGKYGRREVDINFGRELRKGSDPSSRTTGRGVGPLSQFSCDVTAWPA